MKSLDYVFSQIKETSLKLATLKPELPVRGQENETSLLQKEKIVQENLFAIQNMIKTYIPEIQNTMNEAEKKIQEEVLQKETELTARRQKFDEQFEKLRTENIDVKSSNTSLQTKVIEKSTENDQITNKIAKLNEENQKNDDEIYSFQEQIDTLQLQSQIIDDDYESFYKQLDALVSLNENLKFYEKQHLLIKEHLNLVKEEEQNIAREITLLDRKNLEIQNELKMEWARYNRNIMMMHTFYRGIRENQNASRVNQVSSLAPIPAQAQAQVRTQAQAQAQVRTPAPAPTSNTPAESSNNPNESRGNRTTFPTTVAPKPMRGRSKK